MYQPRSKPLDPDSPAGRAVTIALGDVLAELREAVIARRRLKAARESVVSAPAEAA